MLCSTISNLKYIKIRGAQIQWVQLTRQDGIHLLHHEYVQCKRYVGQTKQDYEKRWYSHIKTMERNAGCPALKTAMLKYGVDRFRFEVLIVCFDCDLDRYEIEYISKFDTMTPRGYNVGRGGHATYGFKGKTHSEETREKLRAINVARQADAGYRQRASVWMTVKYETDPHFKTRVSQGIRNSAKFKLACELGLAGGQKGSKHQDCTKKKISESVSKYFKDESAVERHRAAMAHAKGRKTVKCSRDGHIV